MVRTHCVGCRPLTTNYGGSWSFDGMGGADARKSKEFGAQVPWSRPTKHKYVHGYRYNDITIFKKLGHNGIRILINY